MSSGEGKYPFCDHRKRGGIAHHIKRVHSGLMGRLNVRGGVDPYAVPLPNRWVWTTGRT